MSRAPVPGPVVFPTDLSAGARAAFPYAVYLAALLDSDLHLLHVRTGEEDAPGEPAFPDPAGESERVRGWLREGPGASLPAVRREVRDDDGAASGILGYASETDAGAVCMGTHGRRGLRRLVLGSVTEEVIRRARSPVLTVRRGIRGWPEGGPRRVLTAVDLSPMTKPALAWAGRVAEATGASLEAVHVVTTHAGAAASGKRQRIHRAYGEAHPDGVDLDSEVMAGDPADRITAAAEEREADLVVAATHGRSGPSRLVLGSVSEALVRRAPCPVLVVSDPPPEGARRRREGPDADGPDEEA